MGVHLGDHTGPVDEHRGIDPGAPVSSSRRLCPERAIDRVSRGYLPNVEPVSDDQHNYTSSTEGLRDSANPACLWGSGATDTAASLQYADLACCDDQHNYISRFSPSIHHTPPWTPSSDITISPAVIPPSANAAACIPQSAAMASCPSYSALTSRHGSMIHTGNSNGDDVQLEHGLEGGSYVPEFDPPSYDASFHVPASEGRQEEREVLPSYRRKELLPPAWSPLKVKKRRAPASTILARSSSPPSSMPPFLASSKSSLRHSSWYLNQSAMVAACQADAEREVAEALRQKKFKRLGHGGSTRLILGAA